MRRLPLPLALAAGCALAAGGVAATKPKRMRTETAPIVAVAVGGGSVTYAVADNAARSDCAHVVYWHTASGNNPHWRFGKRTDEPCVERPSTGDGISAVAMATTRSLWIQYAGGNLRDWQLFTATPTRTQPRQLAFVEQDVDLPPPIVVGQGSRGAVPYAVKANVTFLGDNGAAVFKWTAPSAVRLLAAGVGPGSAEVAAFLDSGVVVLLSRSGQVVQSYAYGPGEVSAISLAAVGVLVQDGASVQIRKGAQTTTVPLPAGAKMIGFGQGRIFYSLAGTIHAIELSTSADWLVASAVGKTAPPVFSTDGGLAWANGNTFDWACTACLQFSP